MTDEQDDQSSSQDSQDVSQETSNQGTSISFDVQGDVPAISQPKSMACWATVTTMNMSWTNQQSYSIELAMDSIGSDFRKIFDDNTGLAPDRVQELSDPTGMKVEYQRCETPASISQLLQNYGPLVIIDDEDPSPAFAVHARIIRGMYGDGNAENTYLKIVDPNGGKTYDESFQDFTSKYEAMANATA
jgi:Papain-like cysteine protease AvrRpt2